MESILEEWTTLRSPDALGAIFLMPSTWFEILVKDVSSSRSLLWFLCSVVCVSLCVCSQFLPRDFSSAASGPMNLGTSLIDPIQLKSWSCHEIGLKIVFLNGRL